MKIVTKQSKVIEVEVEVDMEEGKFYEAWGILICPIGNEFVTFTENSLWVKESIDASDANWIKGADMDVVKKKIAGFEAYLNKLKALIP